MRNTNLKIWLKNVLQKDWITISIFIIILIFIITKSLVMPASDDEYMSIRYFVDGPWLNIFTSETQFNHWIPNNHILNSLLMKLEILIFGRKDWAIRIHSIVAFVFCFYYCYKTLSLSIESKFRIALYLSIIFLNPFLLDFFCIARGYALSFAAWTASYYYLISYLIFYNKKQLIYSQIALFIGIYSNFSTIYLMLIFISIVAFNIIKKKNKIQVKEHLLAVLTSSVIIFTIVAIPLIKTIASKSTFGGQTGLFSDTIVGYVNHFIHHNPAIDRHKMITENIKFTEISGLIIFINWCLLIIAAFFSKKNKTLQYNLNLNIVFLVSVALICKFLFILFKVPYPMERTVLLFSFPFYYSIVFALEIIIVQRKRNIYILYLITIFMIWHFIKSFTFYNTIQWWQNGDSKELVEFIKENYSKDEKKKIAVESWQLSSFAFYAEVDFKDNLELIWAEDFSITENYDLIFIPKHIETKVKGNFKKVAEFRQTILLEKVKE